MPDFGFMKRPIDQPSRFHLGDSLEFFPQITRGTNRVRSFDPNRPALSTGTLPVQGMKIEINSSKESVLPIIINEQQRPITRAPGKLPVHCHCAVGRPANRIKIKDIRWPVRLEFLLIGTLPVLSRCLVRNRIINQVRIRSRSEQHRGGARDEQLTLHRFGVFGSFCLRVSTGSNRSPNFSTRARV